MRGGDDDGVEGRIHLSNVWDPPVCARLHVHVRVQSMCIEITQLYVHLCTYRG